MRMIDGKPEYRNGLVSGWWGGALAPQQDPWAATQGGVLDLARGKRDYR